jgi:hypothetical protein
MRLFSYVVDHDTGLAPNPENKVCTLAYCKYKRRRSNRKNVVELAHEGDWIVGTGGESNKSSGNGYVVYIMRVDERLPFDDYLRRFLKRLRPSPSHQNEHGEFALVSRTFLYCGGSKAIEMKDIPGAKLNHLEKKGPGFRSNFPEEFIRQLADWVHKQRPSGKIGEPCAPGPDGTRCRTRCCGRKQK